LINILLKIEKQQFINNSDR